MSEVFWDCPECGKQNAEEAADREPMFDAMSRCKNEQCKQGAIHMYQDRVVLADKIPKSRQ
jgi:hypothetical protein